MWLLSDFQWKTTSSEAPTGGVEVSQYIQVSVGVLCALITLALFALTIKLDSDSTGAALASKQVGKLSQDVRDLSSAGASVINEKINGGSVGFQSIDRQVGSIDADVCNTLRKSWSDIRRDALMNRVNPQSLVDFERSTATAQLQLMDDSQRYKSLSFVWLGLAGLSFLISFAVVIMLLRRKPTEVVIERVVQTEVAPAQTQPNSNDDWLMDVSRRHFESTFEKLPVACASFSTDGKITAWNEAMESVTGLSASEVFQKSFWDMVQWDRLGELGQNTIYKLLQGEPIEMVDWVYEHPLGEKLDFRIKLLPVVGSTGSVISAVGAISDVTLQRRQECMLIENDVTKTAMLSAIPDTLLRLDFEGRLVDLRDNAGFVSKSAITLLGETSWPEAFGERLAEAIKEAAKASRHSRGYTTAEFHSGNGEPQRHIEIRVAPCGQSDILAILHDITDRHLAQTAIQDAAARLRHLVEGSADLLALVDSGGTITYQSPASRHVLGVEEGANIGRKLTEVVAATDQPTIDRALNELTTGSNGKSRFYVQAQHPKLGLRDMEIYARNLLDNPYVQSLVFNIRDVTDRRNLERELNRRLAEIQKTNAELESANKVLSQMATTDGLTGLRNHRTSQEYLAAAVTHCQKTGSPISLAVIDVDFFKKVNDTYGHQEGDRILQWLGLLVQKTCRNLHLAGRYGGEEFVLIMPDTDAVTAQREVEALRQAVEQNADRQYKITISAGVVTSSGGSTAAQIFAEADRCLYASKQAGRNRVTATQISSDRAA